MNFLAPANWQTTLTFVVVGVQSVSDVIDSNIQKRSMKTIWEIFNCVNSLAKSVKENSCLYGEICLTVKRFYHCMARQILK